MSLLLSANLIDAKIMKKLIDQFFFVISQIIKKSNPIYKTMAIFCYSCFFITSQSRLKATTNETIDWI